MKFYINGITLEQYYIKLYNIYNEFLVSDNLANLVKIIINTNLRWLFNLKKSLYKTFIFFEKNHLFFIAYSRIN